VVLVGPDEFARVVEGKALLVVAGDDLFQLLTGYRKRVLRAGIEEDVHTDPPAGGQLQTDPARVVPQVLAE
jgi:hypothetical protein